MKLAIENIRFTPSEETDERAKDITNIADSLKDIGLSHPVIVRPGDNGNFLLVSGEKRIRAALQLEWKEIDVEVRNVSEVEGKIIQTHENLKRHNLPLWEQVALVEALHSFRQEEHGEAERGRPKKGEDKKPAWGIRDTAQELGISLGSTAETLQLARAVQLDPSLRNIQDKRTAVRLVRIAAQRHQAEEEAGLSPTEGVNQAYLGDSATILSKFPAQSIDHCVTDPPWIKYYEPTITLDERTLPVFKEVYRVLRHDGFLAVFAGLDDYSYYCGFDRRDPETGELIHTNGELERIGFNVSKTPLIWHKINSLSRRGVRSWEYDRSYEFVIIATKGSPAMTVPVVLDGVKSFAVVPPQKIAHQKLPEKPIDLLKDIIKDLTYEGNVILDPFGGSFSTAVAAKEMKRRYVVCEKNPEYYHSGRKRLGLKE
jgi:DNA modification methylase